MPGSLTRTAANLMLDWVNGVGTPTRPTLPLKVALMTVNGDATTNGTEVTGGSYARQTLVLPAAVAGAASNSANMVWTGMPAVTVVGVEIWDSATVPVRLWREALPSPKGTTAGDEFRLPAGSLSQLLS